MLAEKLDAQIKSALLSGDKDRALQLRGLKSALLYEAVHLGKKDTGLSEPEQIAVLQREAKKRAESAAIYTSNGAQPQAEKELREKAIIEEFLPAQLGADELDAVVDRQVDALGASGMADMGKVIGAVKAEVGGQADGAAVAAAVKRRLAP